MDDRTTVFSIKEFSEFTGLSESTLRYYDKIGLLSPIRRGGNRYRYYAPHQIISVEFIKVLVRLNVPLSVIRKLYRDRAPQDVLALLTRQQNILNTKLFEIQTAYTLTHTYSNNIQTGIAADVREICVQELEEVRIALGGANDFGGEGGTFYKPFIEFCNTMRESGIDLHYPIGSCHRDMGAFVSSPSRPFKFFSMDPRGSNMRTAGQYLVAYHKGFYGEFGDLPQRMQAHARANGISFRGPVYTVYLLDEISVAEPNQYLSQVVVGVTTDQYRGQLPDIRR